MEKRFLLAVVLSFFVLLVYSSFLKKTQPTANKYVTDNLTAQQTIPSGPAISEKPKQKIDLNLPNILDSSNLYNYTSNGLDLKFSKIGGFILEAFDKTHKSAIAIKDIGLVKEWSQYAFNASQIPNGVVFDYQSKDGYGIKKIFRIMSNNGIDLTINIYNITTSQITGYDILNGEFNTSDTKDPIGLRYYEASFLLNDTVSRKQMHGKKKQAVYEGNIAWTGLRDRYFCTILMPQFKVNKALVDFSEKGPYLFLSIPERNLTEENSLIEDQYKIYIGPQDAKILKNFGGSAEKIVNFGMFDAISKALLFLLYVAHNVTKNWGVSIICVTILVYFLMFPLSLKSMLSMKKMQALQPKMEELRAKYKDDPKKLNIEIMELYKREKVNPFGGCLPMLLQIPVFFALYQLLMRFISLKGAHFLWIQDLAEPDRVILFKNSFPIIGNELNILPILMAIGMFFQQKLSSLSTGKVNSSTAEQQKMMTIVMPVLFGFLFYKMSSGLVLYWFVNSLLMLGFQWKISRVKV